jgi:hypothetical protein
MKTNAGCGLFGLGHWGEVEGNTQPCQRRREPSHEGPAHRLRATSFRIAGSSGRSDAP